MPLSPPLSPCCWGVLDNKQQEIKILLITMIQAASATKSSTEPRLPLGHRHMQQPHLWQGLQEHKSCLEGLPLWPESKNGSAGYVRSFHSPVGRVLECTSHSSLP